MCLKLISETSADNLFNEGLIATIIYALQVGPCNTDKERLQHC